MRLRAPTHAELEAVFAVLTARDTADLGLPDYTLEDLRGQWQDTEFELSADARVAEQESGPILAYAQVDHHGAIVAVSPEHEGKGAGTMLREWVESRERELGRPHHGQPVASTNMRGQQLLAAAGYEVIRSYFRMAIPLKSAPLSIEPPPGVVLRAVDPERDVPTIHAIDDRSFADAADYRPETIEAFRQRHLALHDFDAEASLLACRGEQPVGFLLGRRWRQESVGFVNILGVDPAEQGAGTGTALICRAFAIWAAAGLGHAELGVSSQNVGARRLYERLGMAPRFQIDVWQRGA